MLPNNHTATMRPIIKTQQPDTSVRMDLCTSAPYDCSSSMPSATTTIDHYINQATMIQLNYYIYYARAIPNYHSSSSNVDNPCRTTPTCLKPLSYPTVMKILENAVRLDDIEPHWHICEEDSLLYPYHFRPAVQMDSADLDLFSIHCEAQQYNDCRTDRCEEYQWDYFLKLHEPIICNEIENGKLDYDYLIVNPIAIHCIRRYFENLPIRRMPYTQMFECNGCTM